MRWEDERYVRSYTRDTAGWLMMPWQGRAVQLAIIRKLDRAGVLDLAEYADEEMDAAVGVVIGLPQDVVAVGLAALLKRKTFVLRGQYLVMPNYIEAQECAQSDKHRKAEQRSRYREQALAAERGLVAEHPKALLDPDDVSRNVTPASQNVTKSHTRSQPVTASHSEPCLTVPSLAVPNQYDGAANATPDEPKASPSRGTRLTDAWQPNETTRAKAESLGFGATELESVLVEFKNFWIALPGKRATKLDWDRTFQNRLSDVAGRRRQPPASGKFAVTNQPIQQRSADKPWLNLKKPA